MDKLLTPIEAGNLLSVKPGTLYAWVHRGQIAYVRLGKRCVRFSENELQKWVAERTIQIQSDTVRIKR